MDRYSNPTLVVVICCALALVVGCASPQPTEEQPVDEPIVDESDDDGVDEDRGVLGLVGTAVVRSGDGDELGTVTFTQTEDGVLVEGRLEGLEPGPKGFHVHEHGQCDPPDFESAGGHFNPTGHPHGGPDDPPELRHAGDFGNIEFDEDGVAEFSFVDDVITLGDGTNDVAGQALIVHYDEDDKQSQPTGAAGPRAGCGIVEVIQPAQ